MKPTKSIRKKGTAAAVILAGGSGLRFSEGNRPQHKQFVLINGFPAVVRSVTAFENCPLVDEIILVSAAGDEAECEALLNSYHFQKVRRVVTGGVTRQESAKIGLDAISNGMKYIALHDAARCLVTEEMIENVFAAAYADGAAIAAQPARDTIKTADRHDRITGTVDRKTAWYAQTPQIFLSNLYRAAAYVGERDGVEATDDASLVEHIGQAVTLVDCGSRNIKLTYPEDAVIAKAILQWQQKKI